MTEAPKKIWMSTDAHAWAMEDDIFNVPYIRADLVHALVEALEKTAELVEILGHQAVKARAALKALEEK